MQGSEPQFPRGEALDAHSRTEGSETSQERVFFAGHARHSVRLGQYILGGLTTLGLIVGGVIAMDLEPKLTPYHPWTTGVIGLLWMGWTYLKHVTTRYRLTDRRVEFERGVIGKDVDSLELWRILDVRFQQSAWDRMLGNGKIVLVGTDRSHPELVLHGLPQPRRLFEQMRDAVQAARARGRPMEFVGEGSPFEPG